MAALKGAASLTRIMWVTANLLFEKGESAETVHNFLQTFVDIRTVRKWKKRFEAVHGFPTELSRGENRRLPVPPIDFSAVTIVGLQAMTDPPAGAPDGVGSAPDTVDL